MIGYTDSTGGHDLNMRLSQQRADSVASALITQGVDASRIRTQRCRPANPIASNSTAEGEAKPPCRNYLKPAVIPFMPGDAEITWHYLVSLHHISG